MKNEKLKNVIGFIIALIIGFIIVAYIQYVAVFALFVASVILFGSIVCEYCKELKNNSN